MSGRPGRQKGEVLHDFDVLTLCDTGAQWYTDVAEREHLELERRLKEPLALCLKQSCKHCIRHSCCALPTLR